MPRRVAALFVLAFIATPSAHAATLPDIKINPRNTVPECVTPGRLTEYLKSRNPDLDRRFESVATEYMRVGERLGVRWDFAFYQMILETGSLSFRRGNRSGDVKPAQNNFAGLGATGRGEPGESFRDVATGVQAHLEHLLLYSGEKLDSPVAERTRKVQEWGVLTKWQAKFGRPITFSDLAAQWAPGSGGYARMLDGIAERFEEFCEKPDPRPEIAAAVRRELRLAAARAERPSGEELAQRAIATGKAEENDRRAGLGAPETAAVDTANAVGRAPSQPYKVINSEPDTARSAANPPAAFAPRTSDAADAADAPLKARSAAAGVPAAPKSSAAAEKQAAPDKQIKVATAAGAAKSLVESAPASAPGQKCRVWTASYGGQKALIIRSVLDKVVNFTVLDVNDGAEKREADAFISAYAKDGAVAGEFTSQAQALDKAFEMCPEG